MLSPYPSPVPKPPPRPTPREAAAAWPPACFSGRSAPPSCSSPPARPGRRATAAVGGGSLPLTADGQDVTGLPAALAIVGLAALVAVFAVRSAGRLLVAGLLALSGLGAGVSAYLGASDSAALDEKAAQTTGDASATVDALSHTAWPYVTAVGGLLILLAGLLALRYGKQLAHHVGTVRARRHPAASQGPPGRPGPGPARGPVEGPGPR